ncbi:MAG TPA: type II secretion system protein GspL, partial [Steroidobacteraceae bacterium]
MESLIIHLRDGASPQWMVCNPDGHVLVNATSGDLTQAAALGAGRRVCLILPAGEALVTDSEAPAKSAAKLAQVIPYALEERVADEI